MSAALAAAAEGEWGGWIVWRMTRGISGTPNGCRFLRGWDTMHTAESFEGRVVSTVVRAVFVGVVAVGGSAYCTSAEWARCCRRSPCGQDCLPTAAFAWGES